MLSGFPLVRLSDCFVRLSDCLIFRWSGEILMSKASASDLQWRILKFNELSARLLYRIMAARQAVFVVEQQCVYQDLDGLDECAVHVCALAAGKLYAYARILPPQKRFEEPSIGRVLTVQTARGAGLGRTLMH